MAGYSLKNLACCIEKSSSPTFYLFLFRMIKFKVEKTSPMPGSLIEFIIPENIKGKAISAEHSVSFNNVDEAIAAFKLACSRMHDINSWHKSSGFASAKFSLKDSNGTNVERPAQLDDYVQIDIPGPGPASGDGYDWVQVEALENEREIDLEQESCGMRVRTCKNPNKTTDETAHFLTSDATSTFIIHRSQNIVMSEYYGRNEMINTGTEKTIDKIRNAVTGASALAGVSELQWSRTIKSFLETES